MSSVKGASSCEEICPPGEKGVGPRRGGFPSLTVTYNITTDYVHAEKCAFPAHLERNLMCTLIGIGWRRGRRSGEVLEFSVKPRLSWSYKGKRWGLEDRERKVSLRLLSSQKMLDHWCRTFYDCMVRGIGNLWNGEIPRKASMDIPSGARVLYP
jgi:hypothetical protein